MKNQYVNEEIREKYQKIPGTKGNEDMNYNNLCDSEIDKEMN